MLPGTGRLEIQDFPFARRYDSRAEVGRHRLAIGRRSPRPLKVFIPPCNVLPGVVAVFYVSNDRKTARFIATVKDVLERCPDIFPRVLSSYNWRDFLALYAQAHQNLLL